MRTKNRRHPSRVAAVAAAAAAALVLPVAPAVAAGTGDILPGAKSSLELTLSADRNNPAVSVTLECEPAGGTHPTPQSACDKLAAADGDPRFLQPLPVLCSAVHDPVTATATGHWHGRQVNYRATFTNRCEAAVGTDLLFRF
ncbi:hypothetical protein CUT44_29140 [Streptomyces carminius]|uniref:Subtilisin inhibitor domain-containing protein n=1 Tax=Streptomyces carminius TaxID=2665496 RepID=A0A2M8LQU5_9ACTN|nr:SSI family serine proteinase inhibitor [Streptomyces carminius]PJE94325.1 hypothetical protein CUT44_29140 [Streptomyces carminius]